MLNIQVLGSGIIPRKGFLAPHKEPFPAELQEIGMIMRQKGLKINYLNPETNEFVALTRDNLMEVWNKYGRKRVARPSKMMPAKSATPPVSPTIPAGRKIDTEATEKVQTAPQDDIILPKPETSKPQEDIVIATEVVKEVKEEIEVAKIDIPDEDVPLGKKDDVKKDSSEVKKESVESASEKSDNTFTPKYSNKKKR